jgi:hypothetical protein
MKQIIKLNQTELKQIIAESIKKAIKESYSDIAYTLEDEASGEVYANYHEDELDDAINDAKEMARKSRPYGKFLVVDKNDNVVFDTDPKVSYKI